MKTGLILPLSAIAEDKTSFLKYNLFAIDLYSTVAVQQKQSSFTYNYSNNDSKTNLNTRSCITRCDKTSNYQHVEIIKVQSLYLIGAPNNTSNSN